MSVISHLLRVPQAAQWLSGWNWKGETAQTKHRKPEGKGQVVLIGAGPGDPELLTVKAQRLLQQADVLLFDSLVSAELLAIAPRRCKKVFVGKRAGRHAMPQQEINLLLIRYAREMGQQGGLVVRLKGGDPAIFGRVSEEAAALQQAGIAFAIVPGVTSACAASAYCGIPLTARGYATSVQFLTAQFADPAKEPDWSGYQYRANGSNPTMVVYMGLNRLQQLCAGLVSVGWPQDTPIALLDQVSTAQQTQLQGTLLDICERLAACPLAGPTLIVVGEVLDQRMKVDLSLLQQVTVTS
ncbi:MAG: uroporphyrinogen-III C-methyltransferase [Gammaproteobacteria bacterium]|nr:uroporphyrinogen-III C-methyltransferase [Gammaproteobacteria bacterium]MBU2059360.1 uroporphyrinogen-III C-methyltransferase [Gammaproteobacteria bacterium]MBU2175260.1 uroporphyrinogen-III C-methyltransferase [Gammaproteobacteria bacterium]MBU2247468.1 uroporphyrinogen-III C-methyltransferase [Gammaproteobacteria bacterium]MBU2346265.1 uroporphyrinogen-III C-methyltransferase [Gammaproteobacteria bacterium]